MARSTFVIRQGLHHQPDKRAQIKGVQQCEVHRTKAPLRLPAHPSTDASKRLNRAQLAVVLYAHDKRD